MQTYGAHLDALTHIVRQNKCAVEQLSTELSPTQLEWRPAPRMRSVAEWVETLVGKGEVYLAMISEPMLAAWHDPSFQDIPYKRTLIGHCVVIGARTRGVSRRVASHGERRPVPAAVFARFRAQQSDLLDLIDEARDVDLRRIRVASPLGRVMGLSIGDALELLAVLQQRGLQHATHVLETSGFPTWHTASPSHMNGVLRLA